jgi:hypothetical protein
MVQVAACSAQARPYSARHLIGVSSGWGACLVDITKAASRPGRQRIDFIFKGALQDGAFVSATFFNP